MAAANSAGKIRSDPLDIAFDACAERPNRLISLAVSKPSANSRPIGKSCQLCRSEQRRKNQERPAGHRVRRLRRKTEQADFAGGLKAERKQQANRKELPAVQIGTAPEKSGATRWTSRSTPAPKDRTG